MTPRLRTWLLASAAPALALPSASHAVDVDTDLTAPVETATADNGSPGDVAILSGGSITLDNGVAVTLNSDNSVDNAGSIVIDDADGATGVRVLGGFIGSVNNTGGITLREDYSRTDVDGDGTLDGPFAQGSGRTGILIEGPAAFTGDVRHSGGSISIEGNDSYGVRLMTDLDGSYVQAGTIGVTGDHGAGVELAGDVSGDVRSTGRINAIGEGAQGVVVRGDVGGGVVNGGTIATTGFQYSTFSNYYDPDAVPDGYEPVPFDEDDLKAGGPALAIGGSVAQGVLNDGVAGGGALDDVDGVDDVKDIKGDFDENRSLGTITSTGPAPAVLISPDLASAPAGDVVIGLVVEHVHDTLDDDNDGDTDEVIATFLEEHGFVNRGTITANGYNIGFDSQAVVITGSADGTRNTVVEGGVLNARSITSTAFEADATTVTFGPGAQTPRFDNIGTIGASVNTEANDRVTVLLIDADSMVPALTNTGVMQAIARGDAADIFAIRDLSGTLLSIDNTGSIVAAYSPDGDDDDGDGLVDDLDERTGQVVAIDLSTLGAGQNASIVQNLATPTADTNNDGVIDDNDVTLPRLQGDVRLGAGDDTLAIHAGRLDGDVAFGDGADSLTLDGGATFTGGLSDSDGQLTVAVDDATMNLTARQDITVTSLSLADESSTSFSIDLRPDTPAAARVVATDAISIASGARITPQLVGVGSTGNVSVEILRAEGGLTLADGHSITDNLSIESPFLFEAGLTTETDGSADSVVVNVRRRTPDELGMSPNQAAALEPVVAALNSDDDLLVAVVNITDGQEFYDAYNQLMPEFSVSALQFAVGNIDGSVGAVGNRLDAVRGGRSGAGAAWVQEFGLYLDREATFNDPGYRGHGFGMAVGVDRPFGPFYAVGLNLVGAASSVEQPTGLDVPMSISSAQLGAYAAANWGDLLFDAYAGAGADFFETQRRVSVGAVRREAAADWKAHHATASARLAYDLRHNRFYARPALSVDYFRMDEEPYRETGGGAGVNLAIDERSSELLASTASLTFGAEFGDRTRSWWSPRLRVGYRYENLGHAELTTARFISAGDPFYLRADDLPEAGELVGFTFAAGSRYSSFAFDYDADIRDGFVRHGVRLAFRFIF